MNERPILSPETAGVVGLATETPSVDNGIGSRIVLLTDQVRVVLFGFDAGQELTEHTSPYRALVQILSGSCEFRLGDTWHTLGPGDIAHMPPGLLHAVRARERFSMLLTLFKAPSSTPLSRSVPDDIPIR
jgi:quercetin dioxygenase-like cupin family protein